jgi:hypothetical protein
MVLPGVDNISITPECKRIYSPAATEEVAERPAELLSGTSGDTIREFWTVTWGSVWVSCARVVRWEPVSHPSTLSFRKS